MQIENQVIVDAPIDGVWALLDDLPEVIPCMPGATYLGQEEDGHAASIKIKLGIITVNFKGKIAVEERDEAYHVAVMKGSARDTAGKGAANATVTGQLAAIGHDKTQVTIKTDIGLTGKIAQFGGSLIQDVAGQLLEQFAGNLRDRALANSAAAKKRQAQKEPETEPVQPEAETASVSQEAEPRPAAESAPVRHPTSEYIAGTPQRKAPVDSLDLGSAVWKALVPKLITYGAVGAISLLVIFLVVRSL